ncbi:hypothetical protein [Helicobacter labetoulli]
MSVSYGLCSLLYSGIVVIYKKSLSLILGLRFCNFAIEWEILAWQLHH